MSLSEPGRSGADRPEMLTRGAVTMTKPVQQARMVMCWPRTETDRSTAVQANRHVGGSRTQSSSERSQRSALGFPERSYPALPVED